MPDVTVTLASLPTPCTPGQIYTLKWVCNSEGTGGTFFLAADATGGGDFAAIVGKAIDKEWKPSDVHKLAEAMKPTPCGGGT